MNVLTSVKYFKKGFLLFPNQLVNVLCTMFSIAQHAFVGERQNSDVTLMANETANDVC